MGRPALTLGNPPCRSVSSPPLLVYSVIYVYRYGIVSVHFMIWVVVQYYFAYLVVPIVPALAVGSSFRLALVSL